MYACASYDRQIFTKVGSTRDIVKLCWQCGGLAKARSVKTLFELYLELYFIFRDMMTSSKTRNMNITQI